MLSIIDITTYTNVTSLIILSIILCWILPLILMVILFFIDIQLEQEIYTICTFRAIPIKIVNYSSYFVVCVGLEIDFIKLQNELKLFIKQVGEGQQEQEQERCILQVRQFHIANVLNLLWQVFTILITFIILKLTEYTLAIIKPIIRFGITIYFLCFFVGFMYK